MYCFIFSFLPCSRDIYFYFTFDTRHVVDFAASACNIEQVRTGCCLPGLPACTLLHVKLISFLGH
jgi:hypothetical protein